jgi:hypothetical protein
MMIFSSFAQGCFDRPAGDSRCTTSSFGFFRVRLGMTGGFRHRLGTRRLFCGVPSTQGFISCYRNPLCTDTLHTTPPSCTHCTWAHPFMKFPACYCLSMFMRCALAPASLIFFHVLFFYHLASLLLLSQTCSFSFNIRRDDGGWCAMARCVLEKSEESALGWHGGCMYVP